MKITEHRFHSSMLEREAVISLGVPSGPAAGRPLLWIGGHDHREWLERTRVADYAEQAGMAVVVVDSSKSWGGRDIKQDHYWFESYLTKELPGKLKEWVELPESAKQSFITGFSRGSYLALRIGLAHPGRYGNIISIGGGNLDAYGLYRDIGSRNPGLLETMFDGIDNPVDFERSLFNPENMVEAMVKENKRFPRLSFYCGEDDPLARVVNVRMSGKLSHWGVPHTFRLLPGGHTWELVDAAIKTALEKARNEEDAR